MASMDVECGATVRLGGDVAVGRIDCNIKHMIYDA